MYTKNESCQETDNQLQDSRVKLLAFAEPPEFELHWVEGIDARNVSPWETLKEKYSQIIDESQSC